MGEAIPDGDRNLRQRPANLAWLYAILHHQCILDRAEEMQRSCRIDVCSKVVIATLRPRLCAYCAIRIAWGEAGARHVDLHDVDATFIDQPLKPDSRTLLLARRYMLRTGGRNLAVPGIVIRVQRLLDPEQAERLKKLARRIVVLASQARPTSSMKSTLSPMARRMAST